MVIKHYCKKIYIIKWLVLKLFMVMTLPYLYTGRAEWEVSNNINTKKVAVGHLFINEVPYEAFGCNLARVQVVEMNHRSLPEWMSVDVTNGRITGVPQINDVGTYRLLAIGIGTNKDAEEYVCKSFSQTIIVQALENSLTQCLSNMLENATSRDRKKELSTCEFHSSIVIATLLLYHKRDIGIINLSEFAKHLEKVLNTSAGLIQLLNESSSLLYFKQLRKISILHSDDSSNNIPAKNAIYVSWPVTCGAFSLNSYLAHKVHRRSTEYSSELAVKSFHLTSGEYSTDLSHLRKRRAVFFGSITALEGTPVETSTLPSRLSTSVLFTSSISSTKRHTIESSNIASTPSSSVSNETISIRLNASYIMPTTAHTTLFNSTTIKSSFFSDYSAPQSQSIDFSTFTTKLTASSLNTTANTSGMEHSSTAYTNRATNISSVLQATKNISLASSSELSKTTTVPQGISSRFSTPYVASISVLQTTMIFTPSSPVVTNATNIQSTAIPTRIPSSEIMTGVTISPSASLANTSLLQSNGTTRTTRVAPTSLNMSTIIVSTSFGTSTLLSSLLSSLSSLIASSLVASNSSSSVSRTSFSGMMSLTESSVVSFHSTVKSKMTSEISLQSSFHSPSSVGSSLLSLSGNKTIFSTQSHHVSTRLMTLGTSASSSNATIFATQTNHTSSIFTSYFSSTITNNYSSSTFTNYPSSTFTSYPLSAFTNYSYSTVTNHSSSAFINYSSSTFINYSSSTYNSTSSTFTNYSSSTFTNYSSSTFTNYSSSALTTLATSILKSLTNQTVTSSSLAISSEHASRSTRTSDTSENYTTALSQSTNDKSVIITPSATTIASTFSSRHREASSQYSSSYGTSIVTRVSSYFMSHTNITRSIAGTFSQTSILTTAHAHSTGTLNATFTILQSSVPSPLPSETTTLSAIYSSAFNKHLTGTSYARVPSTATTIATSSSRSSSVIATATTTSKSVAMLTTHLYTSTGLFSVSRRTAQIISYSPTVPQSLYTISSAANYTQHTYDSSINKSIFASTAFETSQTVSAHTPAPNSAPQMLNSIGQLNAFVGRLFAFKIPYDTFYDSEDGYANNLQLKCSYSNGNPLPADLWIRFDNISQTISGLPMDSDYITSQSTNGLELEMIATDSGGFSVRDVFTVHIQKNQVVLLFSITVTIQFDHATFMKDRSLSVKLLNRIILFYNTSQAGDYYTTRISNGSVLYSWSDTSVGSTLCNTTLINSIYSKVRLSSGSPTPEFSQALLPEFPVLKVNMSYEGICLASTTDAPTPIKPVIGQRIADSFVRYAVPLLAVAFLAAIIIAVIIIVKRRRSKPAFLDKYTFKKGQPVLLPEEHELKTLPHTAAPAVILPEDYMYNENNDGIGNDFFMRDYDDGFDLVDGAVKENNAYGLNPFTNPPPPYHSYPRRGESTRDDQDYYDSPYDYPPPTYQLPPLYTRPEDMDSQV